ncbi:hypothetical protein PM082_023393 [Marasmius tenuissimus]|nr:hypothetical protein PM082_023393 [Marasmius tenuissimus]
MAVAWPLLLLPLLSNSIYMPDSSILVLVRNQSPVHGQPTAPLPANYQPSSASNNV